MFTLVIIVHVIACILLIALILIQRGRGGGLVESFSDVESMFGTKTGTFLTRSTTVLSTIFLCTCLALAFYSSRQSKSLMQGVTAQQPSQPQASAQPQSQAPTQAPAQAQTQGAENKAK